MDIMIRTRTTIRLDRPPVLRPGVARTVGWTTSAVVAGLMVVGSLLGLLVPDLYPEAPWAVAAFRGNDLVTLLLVAPVLIAALAVVRRRDSAPWTLLWLGALAYAVYTFAYYAFGAAFNDVFLLHVATLALSIVALVATAVAVDADAAAGRVAADRPTRAVAVVMLLIGLGLVLAWGGLAVRFALTGELPANVMPDTAVHLVYAIDLALLAPSFLIGGLLLWRALPWGYVMAVAVLVAGTAYLVVLEVVGGFQAEAGIAGATWLSLPAIVGAAVCATAAGVLLARREGGSGT
jgi:hypothetical protein